MQSQPLTKWQSSQALWRETWVTCRYITAGTATQTERWGLFFLCPLLFALLIYGTQPTTEAAWNGTRMLAATLQWGVMILTTSLLGLNTIRWQLEENYASDLLTCTTPRRWMMGNMFAVWACTLPLLAGQVLAFLLENQIHKTPSIPLSHWIVYTLNSSITLLTIAAAATIFSLYCSKGAGFVFLALILAAWINYIPEPYNYLLPPIYLLDAKGLLIPAGDNASYTIKYGPWSCALCASILYAFSTINLTTDRLILRKLKI